MVDFVCDMKCPEVPGVGQFKGVCCSSCRTSQRSHLSKANEHLWTDEKGFLGDEGCKLPREEMPDACRSYNCKNRGFYACAVRYAVATYDGEKWAQGPVSERMLVGWVNPDSTEKLAGEIQRRIEKYNESIGLTRLDA